ncbi:MAG: hypothetical protein JSU07_06285 [Bacteroidetes bacterium]|nr:hypothetical protein [Bacteroidota bacterium]
MLHIIEFGFFGIQNGTYFGYDSVAKVWDVGWPSGLNGSIFYYNPVITKLDFGFIDWYNGQYIAASPILPFGGTFNFKTSFDTNFVKFPEQMPTNLFLTDQFDYSDSGRVLLPAITKNNEVYYYLFDQITNTSSYVTTITNFHKFDISEKSTTYANLVFHFNNRFFITKYDTIILIREDFSTKKITGIQDGVASAFTYSNNYYITTYNGKIYQSSDLGETWSIAYTLGEGVNIVNFDNQLIGFRFNQLWLVNLTPSAITFKTILCDGLENKMITSIIKYNNIVWVTTNSGVFAKPYNNFYTYKQ